MRILVLQRGWVIVGEVKRIGHLGQRIRATKAAVIRRWGTKKGLGELAALGPRDGTFLDPCGTVECHELTVVFEIECNAAAWASYLREQEPAHA